MRHIGYSAVRAGDLEAADTIVCQLRTKAQTDYVPASGLALINIARGRMDLALADVAAAKRQGWSKIDPRWEPLRGHVTGL
jgi:hypothetical protein